MIFKEHLFMFNDSKSLYLVVDRRTANYYSRNSLDSSIPPLLILLTRCSCCCSPCSGISDDVAISVFLNNPCLVRMSSACQLQSNDAPKRQVSAPKTGPSAPCPTVFLHTATFTDILRRLLPTFFLSSLSYPSSAVSLLSIKKTT